MRGIALFARGEITPSHEAFRLYFKSKTKTPPSPSKNPEGQGRGTLHPTYFWFEGTTLAWLDTEAVAEADGVS